MNQKLFGAIMFVIAILFGCVYAFGQELLPAPATPPTTSVIVPMPLKVKAKIGGYRVSSYYNSGEGGNIARNDSEYEIEGSVDLQQVLVFTNGKSDEYSKELAANVEKLLKKPFTQIQTVTIREPCPEPVVPYCCGLGRRTGYCCGITRNCCDTPVVGNCGYCRGVGCSHCRHGHHGHGHLRGRIDVVTPVAYGRCAAWGMVVGTPLSCYRDPPHGREFWCDCADHRSSCIRMYGPSVVWQLVPCMCPPGCGRCGGSGRCGH